MDNETKEKAAILAGVAKEKATGAPKGGGSFSLLDVSAQHAHHPNNKRNYMKLCVFSILLSFSLCVSLIAAPISSTPPVSPVSGEAIAPIPFRGYSEAFILHNNHIHAVVVPSISRLVFLSNAPDAPNILRFDPTLADAGATPPTPSSAPDFFNIGGDWVWPVLQTRWPSFCPNGSDWPPPPALVDAPSTASSWTDSRGAQHVLLTRHYSAPVYATLTREFILSPNSYMLYCKQILSRDPDSPSDVPPLSLWHISQVANPVSITFPVPSADFTPTILSGALPSDSFAIKSLYATYTPPPSSEVKLSLPDSALTAEVPSGALLIDASKPFHAELYSNTGLGYAELETITPEANTISNKITYIIM